MTKISKILIGVFIFCLNTSCSIQTDKVSKKQKKNDSSSIHKVIPFHYKAMKFVDSFINANHQAIKQNTALKEHYESLCTKYMLPLIDKKGLYDDIPFDLIVTTIHNGVPYGNFVFSDNKYFIKITCIIKEKQLLELRENKGYLIKFKVAKFQDGVSFDNEFSRIELPSATAYLISFTSYLK